MSQLDQPYDGDEHPIWAGQRLRKKEFEEIISRFPGLAKVEAILHALPEDYKKQYRLLFLVPDHELREYLLVNIRFISHLFDGKKVFGQFWKNADQFINYARVMELQQVIVQTIIPRNADGSCIAEETASA